jgi:class I fructose-bisphosphate aldolase
MEAGATGIAVGRNVWQSKNPLKMSEALKRIIIDDWSLTDAEKALV